MLAAIANTFSNCFKIPELKSRILFTLVVLRKFWIVHLKAAVIFQFIRRLTAAVIDGIIVLVVWGFFAQRRQAV